MKKKIEISKKNSYIYQVMKRFNAQGMQLFPNTIRKSKVGKSRQMLLINECYCHNGHDMITDRAIFDGHKGIMLKVKHGKKEGIVALSPVYGFRTRMSLDLQLYTDEVWEAYCPICDEQLPNVSKCHCEGDLFAMFLDDKADYSNSILLCNRIDCFNSEIKYNDELIFYSWIDRLI